MVNRYIKGIFLLLLIFTGVNAYAGQWEKHEYKSGDFTLPYQLFTPTDTKSTLPLVIVLHGSYEAGTDNQQHMLKGTNIGPDYFASAKVQNLKQAYVIAPQTPVDIRWASTAIAPYDLATTPITPSMDALLKLIDETVKNSPVDASRIYIAGLSRGGQGVWNAALHRPELFAAIAPIAGSGSPKDAERLIKLPIWAFHGNQDEITKVEYTREMIDAIIKAGGTTALVRYTELEGGNHADSWLTAYHGTELWQWMLNQHKN